MDYRDQMLNHRGVAAVGLFSGIGGFELGVARAGIKTNLLCESWGPAVEVLRRNFDTDIVGDIRAVRSLPKCDVVTAGFPCTDLSQVGRTAGIDGVESGLIREVFRLVARSAATWVVLENVPNMLSLHGGAPIRFITQWFEEHGWNWAYRTIDSQYYGVRQRRRRVLVVASRTEDPRAVIFADDAPPRPGRESHRAYGFYWTEGNRGMGWGKGVTPTLKGGSKIGIASPPGIWLCDQQPGYAIARPSIRAGERLQGFPTGWTSHAGTEGTRWKLVGNAVTVPVAKWLGRRLVDPGEPVDVERRELAVSRWPPAAASIGGRKETWCVSERPLQIAPRASLAAVLDNYGALPLSLGATRGFAKRLKASSLRIRSDFVDALDSHIDVLEGS